MKLKTLEKKVNILSLKYKKEFIFVNQLFINIFLTILNLLMKLEIPIFF